MMKRKDLARIGTLAIAAGLGIAAARTVAAQAAVPWLHIRVEETAHPSKVHVNLPMPVVEAALKAAPDTVISDGKKTTAP